MKGSPVRVRPSDSGVCRAFLFRVWRAPCSEVPDGYRFRRCALVHHNGARVAVLEVESLAVEEARALLASQLAWAHLGDVIVVDALPLDKRHNAKIDYPALSKMLKRRDR